VVVGGLIWWLRRRRHAKQAAAEAMTDVEPDLVVEDGGTPQG
jgi:hypothetical protein